MLTGRLSRRPSRLPRPSSRRQDPGAHRRIPDGGHRGEAAGPPRLRARRQDVHEHRPGCLHLRNTARVPGGWSDGWRRPHLLRADGLSVAVPDRERGHGVLLVLPRPNTGSAGGGDPHGDPRLHRRHVGPLGHRLRPARPGPRSGRHLPAGRGGTRCSRVASSSPTHHPRSPRWVRLPGTYRLERGLDGRPSGRASG